jgi:nucleoside 2-deoxyribosyltransferase
MTKSKIYLAARYSRFQEMQGYRAQLEAIGYEVTSRWINGDHQVDNDALAEARNAERIRFATEDRADLMAASIVIAFTEEPRKTTTRGGRHVEAGIAIATGKRLIVTGWRENVFYCLPEVEFAAGGFSEVLDILNQPQNQSDGFQWYWTEGDDLEICQRGGSTREETIAKALRDVPIGGVFTVLEADKQTASAPDADAIIDLFADANEECWGEDGFEGLDGAPEVIASAKHELTGIVEGWFDKHASLVQEPWFFGAQRNEQAYRVTADGEAIPVSAAEVGPILEQADV